MEFCGDLPGDSQRFRLNWPAAPIGCRVGDGETASTVNRLMHALKSATRMAMKRQSEYATPWGELHDLCILLHKRLYKTHDRGAARRYQPRLRRILTELPDDEAAILRAEGLALLCELQGDYVHSIKHRQREIQLMKQLHKSVRKSLEQGDYNEAMGRSILLGRDAVALEERKAIVNSLKQRITVQKESERELLSNGTLARRTSKGRAPAGN